MNSNNSNALVPLKNGNLPAVVKKKQELPVLSLVKEELYLENRHAVREQLPDILGRVLARIWIDEKFHHDFSMNPRGTLETNGGFLPETMDVEFQKPNSSRPRIVVYEKIKNLNFGLVSFTFSLL